MLEVLSQEKGKMPQSTDEPYKTLHSQWKQSAGVNTYAFDPLEIQKGTLGSDISSGPPYVYIAYSMALLPEKGRARAGGGLIGDPETLPCRFPP